MKNILTVVIALIIITPALADEKGKSPRIVAIGDIHGDLDALKKALQIGGLTDSKNNWRGKDSILVQTGDLLDRGDQEKEVMELLERLQNEAPKYGGKVYILNGNHEIMNASLDFRYVSTKGLLSFSSVNFGNNSDPLKKRAELFSPGGPYALKLSNHPGILKLGEIVFTHGGLTMEYAGSIDKVNKEVEEWLKGKSKTQPFSCTDEKGPFWNRDFGKAEKTDCKNLTKVLEKAKAKYLVVGHTIQEKGINSDCGKRIWRIDAGMSKFYNGKPEVLEIKGNEFRILK